MGRRDAFEAPRTNVRAKLAEARQAAENAELNYQLAVLAVLGLFGSALLCVVLLAG